MGFLLFDIGFLDQIREEVWELDDKESVDIVRRSKMGKSSRSISFAQWEKTL